MTHLMNLISGLPGVSIGLFLLVGLFFCFAYREDETPKSRV
jgi:hypothetical protein